jgi:hypothetical protein
MVHRIILAFAILAYVTSVSAAAETPEERQACANDANTLCPDEVPDREWVYACLIKKINQLSPAFIDRSNSAKTPIIWNMALAAGVVVSRPCWWSFAPTTGPTRGGGRFRVGPKQIYH